MSYKVLIVDDDMGSINVLKSVIPKEYEVVESTSGKDAIPLALKNLPHLLIVNVFLPNFEGINLIENLRMQSRTKDISIIVLTKDDSERVLQKCLHLQVDGYIKKPIDLTLAKKSIKGAILNQSQFISSYTNRFIRAFINLNGTGFYAKQMSSAAKILCYRYEIDRETLFDIQQVLGLLSSTFEKHTLVGIKRFYKDMDFAQNLLEILENFTEPKKRIDHIIHSIYFIQKQQFIGKNIEDYENSFVDQKILHDTKKIYSSQSILIEKGVDFELLWAKFSDFISSLSEVDIELGHDFMTTADKVFKDIVIHSEGGLIHFAKINNEIVVFIKPISQRNIESISQRVEIKNRDISLHVERKNKKESFVILKVNIDRKKSQLGETKAEDKKDQPIDTIDAKSYMKTQNIDMQDIQILNELEEDMFDIVSLVDFSKDLFLDILKITDFVRKYGTIIVYLSEFERISNSLIGISEAIKEVNISDEDRLYAILKIYETLSSDLKAWREGVFVNQNIKNIHEFDSKIISNCNQIVQYLQNR